MLFEELWEDCSLWVVGFTTNDGRTIHKMLVFNRRYGRRDVMNKVRKNFIAIDKINYVDLYEDNVLRLRSQ